MSLDSRISDLVVRLRTEFNSIKQKHPVSTKLVSDVNGSITWTFPSTYSVAPYLAAIPEQGSRPYVVNLSSISTTQATIKVYRVKTTSVVLGGIIDPLETASGVNVYITIFPI